MKAIYVFVKRIRNTQDICWKLLVFSWRKLFHRMFALYSTFFSFVSQILSGTLQLMSWVNFICYHSVYSLLYYTNNVS